ncbi:Protein of unknown function [Bacillus mycoides]|nr:Protein of unknown function [Bacillus mycoides]
MKDFNGTEVVVTRE